MSSVHAAAQPGTATARVQLVFGSSGADTRGEECGVPRITAAARAGDCLILATAAPATLEVMEPAKAGWTLCQKVPLEDLVLLPDGDSNKAEVEAMCIADGMLWLAASHSLVRSAPHGSDTPKRALRRLGEVRREANRFLLARVPLAETSRGRVVPVAQSDDGVVHQVEAGKRSSLLLRWIEEDPMLAPFLGLPCGENGIGVAGIAAGGGSVWLGLRGPVVRGHAVVLRFRLVDTKRGGLKARKQEGGRRFRKYLLPLDGLGVRDLMIDGEDLLVLAGPGPDCDGPARLVRWRGALGAADSMVVCEAEICREIAFPFAERHDRPGAVAPWEGGVLVVYETPGPERIDPRTRGVFADLFRLS